jgi:hydroxypyruvate isomerase
VGVNLQGKRVRDIRIALGGVGAKPMRCRAAETLLKDQPYSRELALKAGEISFVGGRTSAHNAFRVPLGIQTGRVIDTLRAGARILEPQGLTMVLEPLSDTPELFLRTSDQAYAICRAVDSPSCKILYDMYHMQRNEGDMTAHIDHAWSEIAYFQIGDNPGRKEPGTGEVNYKNLFRHIRQKGYDGIFGMEHGNSKPGKEGEQAVIDAYVAADSFEMGA